MSPGSNLRPGAALVLGRPEPRWPAYLGPPCRAANRYQSALGLVHRLRPPMIPSIGPYTLQRIHSSTINEHSRKPTTNHRGLALAGASSVER
jgi:hypothetical protein